MDLYYPRRLAASVYSDFYRSELPRAIKHRPFCELSAFNLRTIVTPAPTMPAIPALATVLVTGTNGFIGQWVVLALLAHGYTVHGAFRTPNKLTLFSDLVARKMPEAIDRFKGFVVPEITASGAFAKAIEGVDGVIHLASPTSPALDDPRAAIEPAVKGTLSILESALGTPSVKRIVLASSISAIASGSICAPRAYTEEDWNDQAVQITEQKGRDAPGLIKYEASKTLAERAAWDFMKKHREEIHFDLCVVNPSLVFGPLVDDTLPSPAALPVTPAMVYNALFARPRPAERTPPCFNCVDVRDVTEILTKSLEAPEAGGQRIIANAQVCTWEDWLRANERLGLLSGLDRVSPEDASKPCPPHPFFVNDKSKQMFGITYRGIEETLKGTIVDWESRGWLKHLDA
ncbi:NAD-P-binding protein [Trametes coccinea BRFM310]|uniref:NAD-P-binding protein n=1 Tax=Trametes coccinea (strain BRFM310) TaxID=1353009 RepID=A0A1Y2IM75_TRAC3|nr:NAD-P-binding protein [Trametes coccinea BRFM310]